MILRSYHNILEHVDALVNNIDNAMRKSVVGQSNFAATAKLYSDNLKSAKPIFESVIDLLSPFDKDNIKNLTRVIHNKKHIYEGLGEILNIYKTIINSDTIKEIAAGNSLFSSIDWFNIRFSLWMLVRAADVSTIAEIIKLRFKAKLLNKFLMDLMKIMDSIYEFSVNVFFTGFVIKKGIKMVRDTFGMFIDIFHDLDKFKLKQLISLRLKAKFFAGVANSFAKIYSEFGEGLGIKMKLGAKRFRKTTINLMEVFTMLSEKEKILDDGRRVLNKMMLAIIGFSASMAVATPLLVAVALASPIIFGSLYFSISLATLTFKKAVDNEKEIVKGSIILGNATSALIKLGLALAGIGILLPGILLGLVSTALIRLEMYALVGMYKLAARASNSIARGSIAIDIMSTSLVAFALGILPGALIFTNAPLLKGLIIFTGGIAAISAVFAIIGLASEFIIPGAIAVAAVGISIASFALSIWASAALLNNTDIEGMNQKMTEMKSLLGNICDIKFLANIIGGIIVASTLDVFSAALMISGMAMKKASKVWKKINLAPNSKFVKNIQGISNIIDPIIAIAKKYKLKLALVKPTLKAIKRIGESLSTLGKGVKKLASMNIVGKNVSKNISSIITSSIVPVLDSLNTKVLFRKKTRSVFDLMDNKNHRKAIMKYITAVKKIGNSIKSLADGVNELSSRKINKAEVAENVKNILSGSIMPFVETLNNRVAFDGKNISIFELMTKSSNRKSLRFFIRFVKKTNKLIKSLAKSINKFKDYAFNKEDVASKINDIITSSIDPFIIIAKDFDVKKKTTNTIVEYLKGVSDVTGSLASNVAGFAKGSFMTPDGKFITLSGTDFIHAGENISKLVTSIVGSLDTDTKGIKKTSGSTEFRKRIESVGNFIDKVNSADLQKLKEANGMMTALSNISADIKGNFEGLAKTINEKLITAVDNLKDALEQTNETLDRMKEAAEEQSKEYNFTPSFNTFDSPAVSPAVPVQAQQDNQLATALNTNMTQIKNSIDKIEKAITNIGVQTVIKNVDEFNRMR